MAGRNKVILLEDAFSCLMGKRTERYVLEQFIAFWQVMSWALFPKDVDGQRLLRLSATACLIASIEEGLIAVDEDKQAVIATIAKHEFNLYECAIGILELSQENYFRADVSIRFHTSSEGSIIVDALLQLDSLRTTDHKKRPSLGKAYYLIQQGAFCPKGLYSLTTLKQLWRDWASSFPIVSGLWVANIDFKFLEPFNKFAAQNFFLMMKEDPSSMQDFLSQSHAIQVRLINLLDPQSKKKS